MTAVRYATPRFCFGRGGAASSSTVIDRAIRSAENTGTYSDQAFSEFTEKGTGGRPRNDFRLSRQAAYLVALNGDPNKPQVAPRSPSSTANDLDPHPPVPH